MKEAISRNPLVGREVGDTGVRMIFGHPERSMPIALYYEVHGNGDGHAVLVGARPVGM